MVEAVQAAMGDGAAHGVRLSYAVEPEPLGTGGGVRNAAGLAGELVAVLNGDVLTDIDLTAMLAFHRARGAGATIYLTRVADPSAYGLVELEDDARVRRFVEKPDKSQITTDAINAGKISRSIEIARSAVHERSIAGSIRYVPALTSPGVGSSGFSRNSTTRPSGSVGTSPNARASSTC